MVKVGRATVPAGVVNYSNKQSVGTVVDPTLFNNRLWERLSSRDYYIYPKVIEHTGPGMAKLFATLTIFLSFCFAATNCWARQEFVIRGRTMGTTYLVKVVAGDIGDLEGVRDKIDRRLEAINQSMSTYQEDSEISRFNRFNRVGHQFKVSKDFLQVMKAGQEIHRLSNGAWDGTVNPLVNLWGFGRSGPRDQIPPKREIVALMKAIGFANIDVLDSGFLVKKQAAVTVDLSSIAKGYGVDAVAALLHNLGYRNYLVEIGGEIFAAGHRKESTPWRIGINQPRADAAFDAVYKVVALTNRGFATSGGYRNFFEVNGIRYSHVIDPRTGFPVSNGVVSVSIISSTCTMADAIATAVMVMGVKDGLEMIDRLDGVEGLIVVEQNNGKLVDYLSKGFKEMHQQ
jgi:thiamine biosynthesis lipoprotein